jgi:hypothetical protein
VADPLISPVNIDSYHICGNILLKEKILLLRY